MRSLVTACVLCSTIGVGVSAQVKTVDRTLPEFVQSSTNVFRRFAVDLSKMKEFYGDVLGLRPLPTLNMPGGGQMTRYQVGTSEIKLQPAPGESGVTHPAVRDAIGLRVFTFFFPDDAALMARFKAHGLVGPEFTTRRESKIRNAMVRDPSGQWVELVIAPGASASTFDQLEVGLNVSNVEKSRAFYRDFVGLDELPPIHDGWLGVTKYPYRLGTTTINVYSFGKTGPALKSSAGIQYVINNVDAVDARAKERSVQIDRPLGPFGTGLRTIWLGDPDGITNNFAQVATRTTAIQR